MKTPSHLKRINIIRHRFLLLIQLEFHQKTMMIRNEYQVGSFIWCVKVTGRSNVCQSTYQSGRLINGTRPCLRHVTQDSVWLFLLCSTTTRCAHLCFVFFSFSFLSWFLFAVLFLSYRLLHRRRMTGIDGARDRQRPVRGDVPRVGRNARIDQDASDQRRLRPSRRRNSTPIHLSGMENSMVVYILPALLCCGSISSFDITYIYFSIFLSVYLFIFLSWMGCSCWANTREPTVPKSSSTPSTIR